MNFFKVGKASVLALGDRRDAHQAPHADIFALFGLLRRLRKLFRGKAALGFLAADVHLQQDILHDLELLGLLVDRREQLKRADGFEQRHLADDIFYLVALEVADEVQGRAVIGVLGKLFRHLLLAVLAQRVDTRGDGGAAGLRVVHLARADERDFRCLAPGLPGRGGDVCAHTRDVFRNTHVNLRPFRYIAPLPKQ